MKQLQDMNVTLFLKAIILRFVYNPYSIFINPVHANLHKVITDFLIKTNIFSSVDCFVFILLYIQKAERNDNNDKTELSENGIMDK